MSRTLGDGKPGLMFMSLRLTLRRIHICLVLGTLGDGHCRWVSRWWSETKGVHLGQAEGIILHYSKC